jgi:hypothetical protein
MSKLIVAKHWDEIPPVLYEYPSTQSVAYSTRVLDKKARDYYQIALALREYIDAILEPIKFDKVMPGVDRNWIDRVLEDKP